MMMLPAKDAARKDETREVKQWKLDPFQTLLGLTPTLVPKGPVS
jgi:hypothetical protein